MRVSDKKFKLSFIVISLIVLLATILIDRLLLINKFRSFLMDDFMLNVRLMISSYTSFIK